MFTLREICWFIGIVIVMVAIVVIDIYRRERKEKKDKGQDDYEVNEKG